MVKFICLSVRCFCFLSLVLSYMLLLQRQIHHSNDTLKVMEWLLRQIKIVLWLLHCLWVIWLEMSTFSSFSFFAGSTTKRGRSLLFWEQMLQQTETPPPSLPPSPTKGNNWGRVISMLATTMKNLTYFLFSFYAKASLII